MKYIVYSDSESRIDFHEVFGNLEQADEIATEVVHEHDGKPYRVILHLDDEYDNRLETYENYPNPCDK